MKKQHIYVNFKRFDVPLSYGGVYRGEEPKLFAKEIISKVKDELDSYDSSKVEFVQFYPEAHLINAVNEAAGSNLKIGLQGVYRNDVALGGNFGAFTTFKPASSAIALGAKAVLIGHCEERNDIRSILALANVKDEEVVNKILNLEVKAALNRGLEVLFCCGERSEEVDIADEVIKAQILQGLDGVDLSKIVVAYEPVWSIGPGKTPADKPYIEKTARNIKSILKDVPVVYGGGLKEANAEMLASISEIDGGLIALTRFQCDIGFYPDEYLKIISLYMREKENCNEA